MGPHPIVLVTGASGQIGTALKPLLTHARYLSRAELDVTDQAAVQHAAQGCSTIIHLAALTDVDECEQYPEEAMRVNAEGTLNLLRAARNVGARVLYLSTDYVFDGSLSGEYSEDVMPSPINHYGRSKLQGEKYVLEGDSGTVVRTSWVIGTGRNFVDSILAKAATADSIDVVDDQRGRPSLAIDVATAIAWLVDRPIEGIVNVAGEGMPCTWAELAEFALENAGFPTKVNKINSSSYMEASPALVAPRPKNSVLSLAKARSLGIPLSDWRSSLQEHLRRPE